MQPKTKADQFAPKWRHFHPQATVWVQNPFDEDVVYQVADESGALYQYRLPAGKVSELPGGMIATLGVKEIVDRLILNTQDEVLRIWDAGVRAKHEESVILRIKEAPANTAGLTQGGEINLAVASEDEVADEPVVSEGEDLTGQSNDGKVDLTIPPAPQGEIIQQPPQVQTPFPGANTQVPPIDEIAKGSLPQKDVQLIDED